MANELLNNLDKLHTTALGVQRIGRVVDVPDCVNWCREQIANPDANIIRRGKNWYVQNTGYIITINASSFTIIAVHKI